MSIIIIFYVILIDIILAILFANVAYKKGYPATAWGLLGFLFPILYFVLLLLPNRYKKISKEDIINVEMKSKSNFKKIINLLFITIGTFLIAMLIYYIVEQYNESQKEYSDYKNYVSRTLAWSYIDLKTNNYENEFKDEKIFVKDLYDLYVDGYFGDSDEFEESTNFLDYYLKNITNVKDDYILIYDLFKNNDQMNVYIDFYSSENITNEMKNYINNVAIDKYINENRENNKDTFIVKLKTLYDKNYILSDYFKDLYKNNKSFHDDYIKITKVEKNYEKNYYE